MKNLPDDKVGWKVPGQYLGQCRKVFNILEQWDGKKWCAVPGAVDPDERPSPPPRLHFGPQDEPPNNPYAGDEAFLPARR